MRASGKRPRTLFVVAGAAALSLAVAGTAAAVVFVYGNSFATQADFEDVDRPSRKHCDVRYRPRAETVLVEVSGREFCGFRPPVKGDSSQPDHEAFFYGKLLRPPTPKDVRRAAYLALQLRVGGGDFYQLQVIPKRKKFVVSRHPDIDGLPIRGRTQAIKPMNETNQLRLRVFGDKVRAFVNREQVANFTDPNPGAVRGRGIRFGVGSRRDRADGPVGVLEKVRIAVPDP